MPPFTYVYILQSDPHPEHFYTGLTDDLHKRPRKHNVGGVLHTAKFRPWSLNTAIAFRNRQRASDFETYRKSYSGRAFARKRL
jgi:predicted GIY-YIG superfamily endonuclease